MKYTRVRRPADTAEKMRHLERVNLAMSRIGGRVLEVTTPIYTLDGRGRPDAEGSGILLAVGARRFLLTAGHVAKKMSDEALGFSGGTRLLPLRGDRRQAWEIGKEPGADDDRIDVAAIELEDAIAAAADPRLFLRPEEIGPVPEAVGSGYLLAGYPRSRQKGLLWKAVPGANLGPRQGSELHQYLLKESGEWLYARAGLSPTSANLVLGYDEEQIWDEEHGFHSGISMRGMSGGGVWRIPGRFSDPKGPPQLVAIFTTCHQGTDKYIVATRMDVVAEIIRGSAGGDPGD